MDNDFKFIARKHLAGKWGAIISQNLTVGRIFNIILSSVWLLISMFKNEFLMFTIFIPLIIFSEPIYYGYTNILYKIYNNRYVGAFEAFSIAFSNFEKSWGNSF